MLLRSLSFLAAALGLSTACDTATYGACGSGSSPGCCQDADYCMTWTASFFQCLPKPSQCTRQFTNYDFYGGNSDIKTLYGLQPSDCCAQCLATSGCLAYTFVNDNPGQSACYLKSGIGQWRVTVGATSAVTDAYASVNDHTDRNTARHLSEEDAAAFDALLKHARQHGGH